MEKEITNYLLAHKNMKIIQRKDMFNFSLDTVLLASFCKVTKNVKSIIDFGTNNAALPLLLSRKTDKKIIGVEIQKEAVDLAIKNVELNNLNNQIDIVHNDIKNYVNNAQKTQMIVCNPPFFKIDEESNVNDNEFLRIARHEVKITLKEIIECAAKILDNKGKFLIVYRPDRMLEVLNLLKENKIEPKRIRFVYPKKNKEANILLVEGIYKGKPGIKIEAPLYAHNDDGSYSDEVRKMFGE